MTDYTDFPQQDSDLESGDMFASPVAVPAPNIDEAPLKCLAVNEEYAKIIALALERMLYHDAWTGTDADVQRVTQQIEHIIGQLLIGDCLDDGGCDQPEGDCVEIGAFHPSIGYFPNHPVLQPDYAGPGYASPAWVRGPSVPGYSPDDAMVDPFSLDLFASWEDMFNSGVPSWTLHFDGKGEIDVEFMMQVQGGMVWIFPDGNILAGDLVDLNWRALDEFNSTDIFFDIINALQADPGIFTRDYSRDFLTDGPHTLTCWYLPVGDLDPPWAFIGGGLRSIQLCGNITLLEDEVVAYTLVQNGCSVELQADGVPVSTIQVMTPAPDCDFQGTVTINHQAADLQVTALKMENPRDNINEEQVSVNLVSSLVDNSHNLVDVTRYRSWYKDKVNDHSAMALYNRYAGSEHLIAEWGIGTTATFYIDENAGQSDGLDIRKSDGIYSNRRLLSTYVGNQLMLLQQANGAMTLWRAFASSGAVASNVVIRTLADGVTPASGFGGSIRFDAHTSILSNEIIGTIEAKWSNATHASRAGEIAITVRDYASINSVVRAGSEAGQSKLGFHNNAPLTRQLITGTSEYAALTSLIGALHNIGLVSDGTNITPDSGGGGAVTEELHTEIYRDFRQSFFGVYDYGVGDNGQWASTLGWTPGQDGFAIALNHDPGYEFIRYRVVYEANFTVPVYIQHGFNVSGLYQEPLTKLVGAGQATYTDERIVERRGGTGTDAWQFVAVGLDDQGQTPYDPALHGSITVQSLDIDVRGYGTLERDTWYWDVYPFFIRRETRYSDLKTISDWVRQPGGEY